MTMTDPLGDMLTRIRNAQLRKKSKVSTPGSRMRQRVLDVLQAEGYIRGYSTIEQNGRSEFEIERVSKPGRRVYSSVRSIPRVSNGLGVAILSTPQGVMSDAEARDRNIGGEVICTIF